MLLLAVQHSYSYQLLIPYSGLFSRRLYFANSQFNSCSRKRMEILNHALIVFSRFLFSGLALLLWNSRNINASKITVVHSGMDFLFTWIRIAPYDHTTRQISLPLSVDPSRSSEKNLAFFKHSVSSFRSNKVNKQHDRWYMFHPYQLHCVFVIHIIDATLGSTSRNLPSLSTAIPI